MTTSSQDHHFLAHALRVAATGLGRTAPNPSVGCVLVNDGKLLAAARSADSGRPHAETQAIAIAGNAARGATAYVTLEPCAHHGNTGPCAQALIDAGIARVVVASIDPDPRVSGRGIAMLQAAGITVETQLMPEAARLIRGFARRVTHGLPYVAMKLASSLDGMISDAHGTSQWITGDAARQHVHRLRGQFDAILTGSGTVLADNPQLTARLPGLPHPSCIRIVCDRRLRLPLTSHLVKTANTQPVWVFTTPEGVEAAASHATELREAGVILHVLEDASPRAILKTLAENGLTRVLVEAGSALSTAFLTENCVDTLYWYRAPILLGNGGKSAVSGLQVALADAARHRPTSRVPLGSDVLECYELASCLQD